jgi:dipeptidyl aminopeptidase/acylaminoacyl peptidase
MPGLVEDAARAAAREGYADLERLGLYGFSQGAHAALWVGAKSRLFKTVVAVNGIADNRLAYLSTGRWAEFGLDESPPLVNRNFERSYGDIGMGGSALSMPSVFVQNSALTFVDQIDASVLLVNSDMDGFSRDQFESMYASLDRSGKVARLVTFWGEGHHMASPANIREFYRLVSDWYVSSLLRAESGKRQ